MQEAAHTGIYFVRTGHDTAVKPATQLWVMYRVYEILQSCERRTEIHTEYNIERYLPKMHQACPYYEECFPHEDVVGPIPATFARVGPGHHCADVIRGTLFLR
jgi:hypothetical protein